MTLEKLNFLLLHLTLCFQLVLFSTYELKASEKCFGKSLFVGKDSEFEIEVQETENTTDKVSQYQKALDCYLQDMTDEDKKKSFIETISEKMRQQLHGFEKKFSQDRKIFEVYLLSLINQENIYMYGAPGVGKSEICRFLSSLNENDKKSWSLQIVRRTTSDTILGGLKISNMSEGEYVRAISPIFDKVTIFLDELPNAESAFYSDLFQVLLREVSNGEQCYKLPFRSLLATGNIPFIDLVKRVNEETDSINEDFGRAFGDRILFGFEVEDNSDNKQFSRKFMDYKKSRISTNTSKEHESNLPSISQLEFDVLNAILGEWFTEDIVEYIANYLDSVQNILNDKEIDKFSNYHKIDNPRLKAKLVNNIITHYALSIIIDSNFSIEGYQSGLKSFLNREIEAQKLWNAVKIVLDPESISSTKNINRPINDGVKNTFERLK